jgi:hypothetical protein
MAQLPLESDGYRTNMKHGSSVNAVTKRDITNL